MDTDCKRFPMLKVCRPVVFFLFILFLNADMPVSGKEVRVRIIQTSDIHGAVYHHQLSRTLELVQQATEEAGGIDQSLRIDCGDLIQGSLYATFPENRIALVRLLNLLHYEVFIPGNHDFEFGSNALLSALKPFNGTVCCANFQWTPANTRAWQLFHKNGIRIAVIGLAYHAIPGLLRPEERQSMVFPETAAVLDKIIPEVMAARPDVIIIAAHAGEHTRVDRNMTITDIAGKYPQINLVLTGHSHQAEPGKAAGRSWRIQAPALAQGIAQADLIYDTDKHKIISLKTCIRPISEKVPICSAAEKTIVPGRRKTNQFSKRPIGFLPFDIRPLNKGEFQNGLSRLFGEAIRHHTRADFAFYGTNSRFRKSKGLLTEGHLFGCDPYEDQVGIIHLTGSELYAVLQEQIAAAGKGFFQSPCGLAFQLKRGKITALFLPDSGERIRKDKSYSCAFSDFALSGASGRFRLLKQISGRKKIHYFPGNIRSIVRNYVKEKYPVK